MELLYEKGIIYKNYLLDLKKAEAAFKEIIDSHSNSPLVMFANYQLGLQNNTEKQFIGSKETEEPEQLTFDCSHYPNPANPTTVIQYTIPEFSDVEINIFNIVGQEILSYSLSAQAPGKHNFMWNAKNLHGELVSSGIYIYKIKVKSLEQNGRNYEKSNKLILLK